MPKPETDEAFPKLIWFREMLKLPGKGNPYPEKGAFPGMAFHLHRAVVDKNYVAHDGKSQTCTMRAG
jgi:hypothetical protein